MLRRLSTLSACFLLFALFAQTVEAQIVVHIGVKNANGEYRDGEHIGNAYYFKSLESAWSKAADTYQFVGGLLNIEFRLYEDQVIESHDYWSGFYKFSTSENSTRLISLTTNTDPITNEPNNYSITTKNTPADSDFFRSESQYTHLFIDSHLTITAGEAGENSLNNATTIERGSNLIANGVTYQNGGPVVIYDSTRNGTITGGTTVRSTVQLQGASFINNKPNDDSTFNTSTLTDGEFETVLAIFYPSSVDLRDATFQDNQGWGAFIYRSSTLQLGTTDNYDGDVSIFQGNTAGNIRFGGRGTTTTSVDITGNLSMYGKYGLYGEGGPFSYTGYGAYALRINQGTGTWLLGEGLTNYFENYGNRGHAINVVAVAGTTININGDTDGRAILDMSKDSKFIMRGYRDLFTVGTYGTVILRGSTQPGDTDLQTYGNYIETLNFTTSAGATFVISGSVLGEMFDRNTGLNAPLLTINTPSISMSGSTNFNLTDIRGNIENKVLVRNINTNTTAASRFTNNAVVMLDGEVPNNNRISATITPGNLSGNAAMTNKDLLLNLEFTNTIATLIPMSGTASSMNWNLNVSRNWRYETKGEFYPVSIGSADMHYSSFVTNDAVVFNGEAYNDFTLRLRTNAGEYKDIYIAQQVGLMTYYTNNEENESIQRPTTEYGMRVSGDKNWTFIGASIRDDFDPKMSNYEGQINHIARLTFDGVGTMNLFNDRPNDFHDGSVIGSSGYHVDEHPESRTYFEVDTNTQTIINTFTINALGDGKHAGETAWVRSFTDEYVENMDWGPDALIDTLYDTEYTVQKEGFGVQFVGYGGTVKINHEQSVGTYESLATDRLFNQRIRVVQSDVFDKDGNIVSVGTVGKIQMTERRTGTDGERIQILVRAADSYWINNHVFDKETVQDVLTVNSGGTIFVDPGATFSMTGDFIFSNQILIAYEDENDVLHTTSVDPTTFYGGSVWVGEGSTIDLTGASIIGNGQFYTRTNVYDDDGVLTGYHYTKSDAQIQRGGAIYFTGGTNKFTGEIASLALSAGGDGRTLVADNVAGIGGAIYFAQGAGATVNVENVDFIGNLAMESGSPVNAVGGGAIFIWNAPDAKGVLNKVSLNARGAGFDNNYAYGAPGGAIRLFQGNTVDLSASSFSYNGAITDVDENGIETIKTVVTTYGGALYVQGHSTVSVESAGFNFNAAIGDGGAIHAVGTVLNGSRSVFTGNMSGQSGGAIYIVDFDNAPLALGGRHVNFSNANFESNTAVNRGGAVFFGDFGTLSMNNATFSNNTVTDAQGRGGAVYAGIGTDLDFTNATFTGNTAPQEGGAIYVNNYTRNTSAAKGTLTINDANFLDNISGEKSGGAVYAVDMLVYGDEAEFIRNEAATSGGALHLISTHDGTHETKTVELNNAEFHLNKANAGVGAAIYLDFDYAVLNAEDATFNSNTAFDNGGAIHAIHHTELNVRRAVFGDSENTSYGNRSLTGAGGAIYLDGRDGGVLKATSTLNAVGATFTKNVAATDGGAVYLLYADADISGATFKGNTAARGGGLFYENENGKDLIVETASFSENTATMGGAVYTVNETFIHAKDTALADNHAIGGDGGALYFESTNSQLDISKTVENDMVMITDNTASGDGGAIRMQLNSKLIANNAVFGNDPGKLSNVAGGSGGAFRIDGDASLGLIADVQASRAKFTNNEASTGDGGAIYLYDESTPNYGAIQNRLLLNGSKFQLNHAGKDGGAIHASNTDVNVASSKIEDNTADGNGGAIYVKNSDLNAWGSAFERNTAGTAGKGGAIYFLATNDHERTLYLGTGKGQNVSFDDNKMGQDIANSIYFETGYDDTSFVTLDVATEEGGTLSMRDPMAVDYAATGKSGNLIDLDIVKTGTGIWELGGSNDFSITRTGTTVDVKEGTFALLAGATLKLTNIFELYDSDSGDYFKLYQGASFSTNGDSKDTGPARLETTNLDFAVGTTMQLDHADLILNVENDYSIGSVLSGGKAFVKEDANVLTFLGATENFNGNVSIERGEFRIFKSNDVEGSGSFETTNGVFYMAPGTDLYLIADPDRPALTAKSATIDLVNLHVSGINGAYENEIILIHTTDGIIGNFAGVDADGDMASDVDYLSFNLGFLNDRKDYGGTIGLRWYSSANNIPAWGKFTVTDYFNVAVELVDNNTNLYTGDPNQPGYDPTWPYAWNGTTLDKFGLGTLELSAQNRYTGATTVHAGELYVTDPSGTGVGDAKVEVKSDARLGLNFTGLYEKTVWGEGQVVVRGGVVELGADNEHTGGTVLKNGILEFTKSENLGTGTITFEGGTLRNKAEAFLNQDIAIGPGSTANFDIPVYDADSSVPSLTVHGVIYDNGGNGGLEKTGKGILALNADNTFTGTSYIREGGLKIDGSVAGDVRVSQYASVGGKGRIGGDLFLRSGAYYDWFFTTDRGDSAPLHVVGNVNLADGAIFRPRTDDTDFAETIVGWTVLRYEGALAGEFTTIDDTFNAFYSFELDYTTPGEVRVAGELLTRPKALGDIVATSLCIANKKLYRNSFGQLARETAYHKTPQQRGVRGQTFQPTRSIWFTPMARANVFGTNYVGGNYDFETYGSQVGSTLWSDNRSTLGLMFGYERGNLRNRLDQIRSHDYYLGLYYGYLFSDGREIRAFVGGGFQKYTMFRYDATENYSTSYDGSSFEMNLEYGKFFAGQNGTLLRPYIAADVEHSSVSSAQEGAVGNAYRHYGKADLSQLFFRLGVDLEKRWQYVDWNGGLSYSCLILGKRRAEADIFYPVRGAGTTSYSARLGRSSMTLQTGLNWHLDRVRSNTFFIDYFADIYMDRTGDGVQHTAAVGYRVRF